MDAMNFNFLCASPTMPQNRSVAVIGAGPSGLAAAGYLSCLGYQVDVYDKLPKPGGLMLFGIPSSRISSERIDRGVKNMSKQFGVNFHQNAKICCSAPMHDEEGDHFTADVIGLRDLVTRFDAIMIATGAWKSKTLGIEGENLPEVFTSLRFLFPIRAAHYNTDRVHMPDICGKTVAVIGAGHSAVDAAAEAIRLGAGTVHHLYRRTKAEAPCGSHEIDQLQELGVLWHEYMTPLRILGNTHVEAIELSQKTAGPPDEFGKRRPLPESEQTVTFPVDIVITALGEVSTPPFAEELGLGNVRKGDVRWLHMTAIDNVFVAGDALTGPSKIGKAIYSGLRAGRSLANWLDLHAVGRESEFKDNERINDEADRFPGGQFRDRPQLPKRK
ncbi:FAD-dependent oxidoreductase [Desulfovibrio inopinatus]|uniref:FAD-dependent oxidoreductase n=1 Tax=Desulfovibrio inopinatus TaxID=102109 RepID=UPI00040164C1|nr:FAD-dependent oxidoreductase [Desulfovibrio inopinatus]